MTSLTALKENLTPIFRKHHIQIAILFGSLAREQASRRSDVDLILIQDTTKRFIERYDGLLAELGRAIPERAVDVLIYTPEELKRISSRAFIAQALREGKVIYESKCSLHNDMIIKP